MTTYRNPTTILIADDDADDRMMIKEAWEENRGANELHFVEDGDELMDYLLRREKYAELMDSHLPGLILLDLNMPKKDGREALREIRSDPAVKQIPVIVLTTSKAEEDIYCTYDLGANSFITKPVTFESMVDIMNILGKYWLDIVDLPPPTVGH